MSSSLLKNLLMPLALLALCIPIPPAQAAGPDRFAAQSEKLDKALQDFNSRFYAAQAKRGDIERFTSINALATALQHQLKQDLPQQAVLLIFNNLALVERNINSGAAIQVIAILLESNEWQTASRLLALARKESDRSVISNMSFAFARQHFYRGRWREVSDMLASIEHDLPPEDLHHALLMQGIAAQNLQEHRRAIEIFAKIPASSHHFQAAQVNLAIANIRQGWWSDAHEIINKLMQRQPRVAHDGQNDRLYTLLGYSFLQQQYYRNARDAFRNVSRDGPYTNRALLGIALCAANQEDYIGALNAVRVLKDNTQLDLPVDEAHLLTAYFYEKLQQFTTASAGYSDAIAYYEQRMRWLDGLNVSEADIASRITRQADDRTISVGTELLVLDGLLPMAFFDNLRRLWSFQAYIASMHDPALKHEFAALQDAYRQLLGEVVREALRVRANFLTSYMNQARFGLARMHDTGASRPGESQ